MKNFIRKNYNIPANNVFTVEFNGAAPNYFRVNNGGATRLYAGVISLPTQRMYDFKIEPSQVRMYCTDKGYPKLYIYNPSGSPVDVIVTAFNEEFSPEVLAFSDFNVSDNEEQTLNVEIGGFTESLPQGNNKIGKVDVANLPTDYAKAANQKDYSTVLQNILTACQEISGKLTDAESVGY